MTIEQIVDIPADRRITLEVPRTIPEGKMQVVIQFPSVEIPAVTDIKPEECPLCAKHRDPETGELRFNAETRTAIEEGKAMMRGEIPTKWYKSLDEMWEDLEKQDDND